MGLFGVGESDAKNTPTNEEVNDKRILRLSRRHGLGHPKTAPVTMIRPLCSLALRPLGRSLAYGALFVSLACAGADAQTVFVCLGGKDSLPAVTPIPAPGHGWKYSAAAPVPGDLWNRILRTAGVTASSSSLSGTPEHSTSPAGFHPLDTATDVPLVDPQGDPTPIRLNIQLKLESFATDKPRSEPAIHSKSKGATPKGLMDAAWRVFLPKNSLVFTLNGLEPARHYDLYVYGSCVDMVSNPDGNGEGARFTLGPENVVPGNLATVETIGGFCSSIYTYNPEADRMTLTPAGTTWARLAVVADGEGRVVFSTGHNSSRRHYVNGFQLVDKAL